MPPLDQRDRRVSPFDGELGGGEFHAQRFPRGPDSPP